MLNLRKLFLFFSLSEFLCFEFDINFSPSFTNFFDYQISRSNYRSKDLMKNTVRIEGWDMFSVETRNPSKNEFDPHDRATWQPGRGWPSRAIRETIESSISARWSAVRPSLSIIIRSAWCTSRIEHSLSVSLLFLHLITCISHRDFSFNPSVTKILFPWCILASNYNIGDRWESVVACRWWEQRNRIEFYERNKKKIKRVSEFRIEIFLVLGLDCN